MTIDNRATVSRRSFVRQGGLLAGSLLIAGSDVGRAGQGEIAAAQIAASTDPLPRRTLGRTEESVTTLTLGTAPCGLSPEIPPPEIAKVVNTAIDLGINSIDTAPAYKQSEEGIGLALGSRRKDVFLATKVMADALEEAEKSLNRSFELIKTDWFDLVYYHNVGDRDVDRGMQEGGVFDWLVKQKRAGKFRFLGISGHNFPHKFIPLLETGEVDVLLTVVNFVDRHTFHFEEKVLPLARQHNTGIVAMKVFGGARKSAGSYANPKVPPEMDVAYLEKAVRYALGVPGVCTANIGVHNTDQLRQNVEMVQRYTELTKQEQQELSRLGRRWACQWGNHFGPVA